MYERCTLLCTQYISYFRPQFAPSSAYPRSVRHVTVLPEEVVDMLTPVILTLVLLFGTDVQQLIGL